MYFPQIRQLDNYNVLIEKKENRHDKTKIYNLRSNKNTTDTIICMPISDTTGQTVIMIIIITQIWAGCDCKAIYLICLSKSFSLKTSSKIL